MKLKIAFTGPESSGKTTISKAFAEEINGVWIEEYAREFLQVKRAYQQVDLDEIARVQQEKWSKSENILIADTEMTVLKIWSEVRFNSCSKYIKEAYHNQLFSHYFLCKPDIPWVEDPLRENPNDRDVLFDLYLNELIKMNRPFTILEGTIETRLTICKNVLNSLQN
jgi:nicotinamide riboside kinase